MNESSYFLTHNARCKCKLSTFMMRSKLGVKWFISCYNLWTQTGYRIILQTFNMILVKVILVPEDHISNPMLLLSLSYQRRVTQTAASSSTLHHLHQWSQAAKVVEDMKSPLLDLCYRSGSWCTEHSDFGTLTHKSSELSVTTVCLSLMKSWK